MSHNKVHLAVILLILFFFMVGIALARETSVFSESLKHGDEVPIWEEIPPASEDWTIAEKAITDTAGRKTIENVVNPTLTAFFPDSGKSSGTAVILCPGGGFRSLPDPRMLDDSINSAKWLLDGGLTVFVLKYRLLQGTAEELAYRQKLQSGNMTAEKINEDLAGPYMRPIREITATDGRQAVKLIRMHAKELGISPDRIGIVGGSSGALLAATVGAEHDKNTRPDFIGVFWGAPPDAFATIAEDAPPAFIVSSFGDLMTWEGSTQLYTQWRKSGRPAELHVYGCGIHMGRNQENPVKSSDDKGKKDFFTWLKTEGFLE